MASADDGTDTYPCVGEFAYCGCNKCTGLEVQNDREQYVPNVPHQQTPPPRENIGTEILAHSLETVMENPSNLESDFGALSLQSDPSKPVSNETQPRTGVLVPEDQKPLSEDLFNRQQWNWKDANEYVERAWNTANEESDTVFWEAETFKKLNPNNSNVSS